MIHILNNIKSYSFLLLLLLLILYGITIYYDYANDILNSSQTIINGISILGVYFTILGIGYTFRQVLFVKEEVQNSLKELNEFLSYSDISSKIRQIEEIQTFILNSKHELARLRMIDLRSLLIEIKHNKRLEPYFDKNTLSDRLIDLSINITNINDSILYRKKINYSTVNKHLDEIVLFLEEISSQLKNKKI
ncbi:MAG: hypothetical protein ACK5KT_15060 [Dysgonomonas sp.]